MAGDVRVEASSRPRCINCDALATCFGRYDNMTYPSYACDECCGHGNEDGWCEDVTKEHHACGCAECMESEPTDSVEWEFWNIAPHVAWQRHLRNKEAERIEASKAEVPRG